jgi:hypothetical protein
MGHRSQFDLIFFDKNFLLRGRSIGKSFLYVNENWPQNIEFGVDACRMDVNGKCV